MFIADTFNNEVDEVVLATGQETVIAGSGVAGYSGDGKQATAADLNFPEDVAVDHIGHLFIADTFNNVIRRVDLKSGMITTIAGNGIAAYLGDGGQATAAELNNPVGIALDGSNLLIADSGNNVIREVMPGTTGLTDGTITTVAGKYNNGLGGYSGDRGPAANAQLNGPEGIAVGATGNLFIADSGNNLVREVKPGQSDGLFSDGIITTVAGDGTAGSAGETGEGQATDAELDDPSGVVVAGGGVILIADSDNDVIRQVNLSTGVITTVAGNGGSGDGGDGGQATAAQLSLPEGLAVDGSGDFFIADSGNNAVREVSATGVITTVAGGNGGLQYSNETGPATAATLANPDGIVVDSQGDLFIADSGFNVVQQVIESPSTATALKLAVGDIITIAGDGAQGNIGNGVLATDAALDDPVGLAIFWPDGSGPEELLIADSANNVIREVNLTTGVITTVAGDGTQGYTGDGAAATGAELNDPNGIAVDASGNIYIADQQNNIVREVVGATGDITTVAGNGTAGYAGDKGPATAAELSDPTGLALDDSGDLFIADTANNVIREVNLSTKVITTVAGAGPASGFGGDGGPPASALLDSPSAVAVDSWGDIYIADAGNNVVREVSSGQLVTVMPAPLTVTASPQQEHGLRRSRPDADLLDQWVR